MTFAEFAARTRETFAAFVSLGVQRGDRIAIVSESRPEWLMADFAALALGAITVPMFPTLTAKQIEYIVHESESKILLVSNDLQFGKAIKVARECPLLETIIIFNEQTSLDKSTAGIPVLHFGQLTSTKEHALDFDREAQRATPEDVITLIYTSGTTGNPKGVMLTHHNLLSNIIGATAVLPEIGPTDTALSFLPLCHAFERIAMYLFFVNGFTVGFAESVDTVAENLLEIRPTVMTGVPRFYERIFGRLMRMREKMPKLRRVLFDWALRIGAKNGLSLEGKHFPIVAKLLYPVADLLVLRKIRARTGGRIRFFVSGAAALPAEVGRAFASFGLIVVEGYGMTEASPIISVNPYDRVKWGTVGRTLPNLEVKIAHDGEILVRGPNVMKGYFKHPEETRETIDEQGWLHTGDIGEIDREQYIRITDRKKHLFVSSGGKNIAPAHIESLIGQSVYIDQIMLIGDMRQYCTALIVPDFEALRTVSHSEQPLTPSELVRSQEVLDIIQVEIDRSQKELATFERVRKFVLLPDAFSVENGMLTPTLKIKRKEVERRYADTIESLYRLRQPEAM
jgi:long-chain acyl-CoA synthetase